MDHPVTTQHSQVLRDGCNLSVCIKMAPGVVLGGNCSH